MTRDEAAALLGVAPTASVSEVESAYRRLARSTHPDRFVGESTPRAQQAARDFIDVSRARDVLLRAPEGMAQHVPSATIRFLPKRSWPLIGTWLGIALFAMFLATYSSDRLPFGAVEPIIRWIVTIGSLLAYALSGMRHWLVIALAAIAATAVVTLLFTSIGGLIGLLFLAAPTYGLVSIGQTLARANSRAHRASPER